MMDSVTVLLMLLALGGIILALLGWVSTGAEERRQHRS